MAKELSGIKDVIEFRGRTRSIDGVLVPYGAKRNIITKATKHYTNTGYVLVVNGVGFVHCDWYEGKRWCIQNGIERYQAGEKLMLGAEATCHWEDYNFSA